MTREPYWAQASSLLRFRDHTQRQTLQDFHCRVISSSQRTIPDKTQPSHQKDIYVPGGIRIRNSQQASCRRPYALDQAASVIVLTRYTSSFILTTLSVESLFHFSVVPLKKIGKECSLAGRKMLPVFSLIYEFLTVFVAIEMLRDYKNIKVFFFLMGYFLNYLIVVCAD